VPCDVLKLRLRQPHRPQRPPGRFLPRHGREVGPHQQPVRAQHVDEVPDGPPVEHQRVVPEPAGQLGRPGRSRPRRGFRPALAGRFLVPGPAPEPLGPRQLKREPARRVAEGQPQRGELLRHPAGNDGRGGQRSLDPDAEGGRGRTRQAFGRHGHRMDEDRHPRPFGFPEELTEPWVTQRHPADVGRDFHAGQSEAGHGGKLRGGQAGILQRDRAEPVYPARRGRAQRGDVLVDPPGQVPPRHKRQRVVQQRRERRDHLGVHPAGRAGGQPLLGVEPRRPRGEPHRPRRQHPRVTLGGHRRPRRVAPGRRGRKRPRHHVRVRVDQHRNPSPVVSIQAPASKPPARSPRAPRPRRAPRRPASPPPAPPPPGRTYACASAPAETVPPR
jgi:hypothetical protein